MLKFLCRVIDSLSKPGPVDFNEADPLQHPELARMSERELADLPFPAAQHSPRCPA